MLIRTFGFTLTSGGSRCPHTGPPNKLPTVFGHTDTTSYLCTLARDHFTALELYNVDRETQKRTFNTDNENNEDAEMTTV